MYILLNYYRIFLENLREPSIYKGFAPYVVSGNRYA